MAETNSNRLAAVAASSTSFLLVGSLGRHVFYLDLSPISHLIGLPERRAEASDVVESYARLVSTLRVRFAPAPTGFLHVGSARTALFNWLYARRHGAEMVLRVEDTDASLKTQVYVDAICEPLRWLGLDWDRGPLFQSERRHLHLAAIDQLLATGSAYHCDLTRAESDELAAAAGLAPGYHGWSRDRQVKDGPGVVVRFRCPDTGETVVDDVVRGRVSFPSASLEDFVIRRGDGSPTFHLANAVDDHDMGISHVIRGEDLLNTTPRVMLLWQALGYGDSPVYAHLPLLVNAKRQKLSKRRDDVALDHYRRRGYLPEALVNYLALLGWGPPDEVEIRPLAEMVELFELDAVKPAPAFFDHARLDHINSTYIKGLTTEEFVSRVWPFLVGGQAAVDSSLGTEDHEAGCLDGEQAQAGLHGDVETAVGPCLDGEQAQAGNHGDVETAVGPCLDGEQAQADGLGQTPHDQMTTPTAPAHSESLFAVPDALKIVEALAPEIQQRISVLDEAASWIDWVFKPEVSYDEKAWHKVMVKGRAVTQVLEIVIARLAEDDFTSTDRLQAIVMGAGDELSDRLGVRVRSQPPVRVALSGGSAGLPLWEPMRCLGKDKTLARLSRALERLVEQQPE